MRTLVTYFRMALLVVTLLSIPIMAEAQAGSGVARERDSLINLISQDTSASRLAALHYQLAEKYMRLGQFPKLIDAADKAVSYSKTCKDYITQYKAHLLVGDYYIMDDDAANAIQRYLLARGALEKKYSEENKAYRDRQSENGVDKNNIKDLDRPKSEQEIEADISAKIGMVYFNRQHYIHSIDYFSDALISYEIVDAKDKVLNMKRNLAISYFMSKDYEISLEYYEELLAAYKEREDWDNVRMIYQRINECAVAQKDYDKALKINRELYNECIAHNNVRESLNALNNVAYAYTCLGEYDKALKYYKQLIDTDPKVFGDDEGIMAGNYTNLGLCYQNLGDFDNAISALDEAEKLRTSNGQLKEAAAIGNMKTLIYLNAKKDIHNAELCIGQAEKNAVTSKDNGIMEKVYQTYNEVLREKGDYAAALEKYQQFLNIRQDEQDALSKRETEISKDLKALTDAETGYQKGINDQELKELDEERFNMLLKAREADVKRLEERRKADSLLRAQEVYQMELERQRYEQDQERLRYENEVAEERRRAAEERENAAKAENARIKAEQAQKDAEQEADKQKQQADQQKLESSRNRLMFYLALVAVLGALAFVFMVRKKNSRLKAQQAEIEAKNETLQMKNDEISFINEEITKQKAVIEEANKQMTDSIVYAKRIQTAVAPNPEFLSNYHFDYFMFFRPRDIVSGDYYWFYADKQNHLFIVAADCTGHGVPGAFMSMLGVSLFNKIVKERQIIRPDLILNEMRNEVKLALHQDSINSSQKDGMDLSLVRIDLDTLMMHFAAANNSGYLFQHFDESEREEISKDLAKPEHLRELGNGQLLKLTLMPADPMPIGVYLREKASFTMTSYQLRPGDSFYLSSDGYVDQFGGKYGRKFLSRNFIKLLQDINDKPMEEQRDILIDTHDKWRGLEYDQLDDIIVIGVRV
ncbi:MAG: tetratricopeptide repeat protein [Bacteroidales bacterium]|nr:tetratricopeptide repeat protein [Bacteroidales bacterium]